MEFAEIDAMFDTPRVDEGYDLLKKRLTSGEDTCELLWRLSRMCHEKACMAPKKARNELIMEGRDFGQQAVAKDATNFQAAKWSAIMMGQATDLLGTKERIAEGGKFKDMLDAALKLNPRDQSMLHLRGRFYFTLANLSWIERKAASVLYAEIPKATMEDALKDFMAAYEIQAEWIENLVYIAKCLLSIKKKSEAKKYVDEALLLTPDNESEKELLDEATQMSLKLA